MKRILPTSHVTWMASFKFRTRQSRVVEIKLWQLGKYRIKHHILTIINNNNAAITQITLCTKIHIVWCAKRALLNVGGRDFGYFGPDQNHALNMDYFLLPSFTHRIRYSYLRSSDKCFLWQQNSWPCIDDSFYMALKCTK